RDADECQKGPREMMPAEHDSLLPLESHICALPREQGHLASSSKLRVCDLVSLRVRDVRHGDRVAARAVVMQHKTQRPVQFEITPATREAVETWIRHIGLKSDDYLFPSRVHRLPHLGTRQYARIVGGWMEKIGLDRAAYGTQSMRRTKPTPICRRTGNLRAVQLLLVAPS